ncbi:DUF4283 domain protein, partial [Trifolium medium]|nr:DUF4283 domain protein [Trifolium medium]
MDFPSNKCEAAMEKRPISGTGPMKHTKINNLVPTQPLFMPTPFMEGQSSGTKPPHMQDNPHPARQDQGKFLSDKPIHKMSIQTALNGMWCNPEGLKVTEMEGNLYQIVVDSEEDH